MPTRAQTRRDRDAPRGAAPRPVGPKRWLPLAAWALVFLHQPAPAQEPPAVAEGSPLAAARTLLLKGKYEEAEAAYGQLAARSPVEAALGLARCRAAVGEYEAAEKSLRAALEKHPGDAHLAAELAGLLWGRGEYALAQTLVDEALRAMPRHLPARWRSAELHRVAGRLPEAQKGYEWFIDHYNAAAKIEDADDLLHIGLAAAEFARWTRNSRQFSMLVNRLYPRALRAEPNHWRSHLEAGLLFLEKYNEGDALSELDAALALNSRAAEVHAAKALLALQNYKLEEANAALDRALDINPRLLVARQLRADALLANFRAHDAEALLEGALELHPTDEDTLGRLAAVRGALDGLADTGPDSRLGRIEQAVVARNPRCGRFYLALASTLDLLRKYPAAMLYYERARERMPQLISVSGRLGMVYMRLGEEDKADPILRDSFKADPFNVRVNNTLKVLDLLKKYDTLETAHFRVRFDPQRDQVLAEEFARHLEEEVYPQVTRQLGFEPGGKTLFEIFSRSPGASGHGWFSARMVGLPYIGTVGACAGKMVALASPNDMPRKYNWARVARHEFVHVVNLQQTDFNVPHWFTEALAVWHEGYPRPAEWNEMLARRQAAGTLFTLENINFGFIRPGSSEDWALAYCQAELYAEFLLEQHGPEATAKMLAAYAHNKNTADALWSCFGVKQEAFEQGYRQHVARVAAEANVDAAAARPALSFEELARAAEAEPKNADLAALLAEQHLRRGALPSARAWGLKALEADAGNGLAAFVLAQIRLRVGEVAEAQKLLETALDQAERNQAAPHPLALGLLAGLRLKQGDVAEGRRLLELGAKRWPRHDKWHKALAQVYLQANERGPLAETLARLAELDCDNAGYRVTLAEFAAENKDHAALERWAGEALRIDVLDARLHAWLAQARAAQGKPAARWWRRAVALDDARLDWRLELARAEQAENQPEAARDALRELLRRQPDFPGAAELLRQLPEEKPAP